MLQKVNKIFIFIVVNSSVFLFGVSSNLLECTTSSDIVPELDSLLRFHILNLLFESFDYFLAEMTSLGELFFDFLVNLDITLQRSNLRAHLVIFIKELLGLFRLIFQFCRQLVVLQDC